MFSNLQAASIAGSFRSCSVCCVGILCAQAAATALLVCTAHYKTMSRKRLFTSLEQLHANCLPIKEPLNATKLPELHAILGLGAILGLQFMALVLSILGVFLPFLLLRARIEAARKRCHCRMPSSRSRRTWRPRSTWIFEKGSPTQAPGKEMRSTNPAVKSPCLAKPRGFQTKKHQQHQTPNKKQPPKKNTSAVGRRSARIPARSRLWQPPLGRTPPGPRSPRLCSGAPAAVFGKRPFTSSITYNYVHVLC